LGQNRYYWDAKYFIEENGKWILGAGIALPVTDKSTLTLGLANTYWNSEGLSLNIGVKVDI